MLISIPKLYADARILENQKTYVCTPIRMVLFKLDNGKVTSQKEIAIPSNVKSFNIKRDDNKLKQWYPSAVRSSGPPIGDGAIFKSAGVESGVAGAKYFKATSDSYIQESFIKKDDNTILASSQSMNRNYSSNLIVSSTCK